MRFLATAMMGLIGVLPDRTIDEPPELPPPAPNLAGSWSQQYTVAQFGRTVIMVNDAYRADGAFDARGTLVVTWIQYNTGATWAGEYRVVAGCLVGRYRAYGSQTWAADKYSRVP